MSTPYLEVWEPEQAGPRVVPLVPEGITIGRRPECDLVLRDGAVTSRHARIERVAGEWYVRDVGSRSGTYLSRNPINVGKHALHDRDELLLGRTRLVFCFGESSSIPEMTTDDLPAPP